MAGIHRFRLATLDISKAYLQAGDLEGDVYMRPPPGWESSRGDVWELLKPAYGLVESVQLGETTVETWMETYGLREVPGIAQLFVFGEVRQPSPKILYRALFHVLTDKIHRLLRCVAREAILWQDRIYIWHQVPDSH